MTEAERTAQAYGSRDRGAVSRWDLRNAGNRQILAERRRLTTRLLDRAGWLPLAGRRVLDVGSGTGAELAWFREVGARDANLVGIALLPERPEPPRKSYPALHFPPANPT